ncbi:hypothetical protein FJTKL_02125 [Diaporthe vaccinii]|uniref:Uncharacterized protein n=1 Tax=Diaporthe vaccinii TaxID=105482 RepID=A0ABR4DZ18_9PEZI
MGLGGIWTSRRRTTYIGMRSLVVQYYVKNLITTLSQIIVNGPLSHKHVPCREHRRCQPRSPVISDVAHGLRQHHAQQACVVKPPIVKISLSGRGNDGFRSRATCTTDSKQPETPIFIRELCTNQQDNFTGAMYILGLCPP